MFKTITSEGSFGLTIGGFASLKKTTLIPVSNQIKEILKLHFTVLVIIGFNCLIGFHIYSQLFCKEGSGSPDRQVPVLQPVLYQVVLNSPLL